MYKITFGFRNSFTGMGAETVTKATAIAAWDAVQRLEAAHEQTDVKNPAGFTLSNHELRSLAAKDIPHVMRF